ncbi:MAG: hypothetical protein AAGC55_05625 [Myxococcota bacterium]
MESPISIEKTYIAYSIQPGFRRFGRAWDEAPRTLGMVPTLPKDGERTHDDVDLLVTKREIAKLLALNEQTTFPLRIAEGAADASAREVNAARRELDRLQGAIAEAKVKHEQAEREAHEMAGQLEDLRRERDELTAAVELLEAQARAAEASAGIAAPEAPSAPPAAVTATEDSPPAPAAVPAPTKKNGRKGK